MNYFLYFLYIFSIDHSLEEFTITLNPFFIVQPFQILGLKKGYVNKPNAFIIDTKGAGPGNLSLAVEGPSKVDVECVDNGDGTCTATYIPKEPGRWTQNIIVLRI